MTIQSDKVKYYKDPMGTAVTEYFDGKQCDELTVFSNICEPDIIPLKHLFRQYSKMPALEKTALDLCYGRVLDVGCGVGSHSLYLQEQGLEVYGVDISKACIEVCSRRGLLNFRHQNIYEVSGKYDTLLLMMNGIGLAGRLSQLPELLTKLTGLLNPGAQILFDSSDLVYLFDTDELRKISEENYYGEVLYQMKYRHVVGKEFAWLYVDADIVKKMCKKLRLNFEVIANGANYDYLGRITMD